MRGPTRAQCAITHNFPTESDVESFESNTTAGRNSDDWSQMTPGEADIDAQHEFKHTRVKWTAFTAQDEDPKQRPPEVVDDGYFQGWRYIG